MTNERSVKHHLTIFLDVAARPARQETCQMCLWSPHLKINKWVQFRWKTGWQTYNMTHTFDSTEPFYSVICSYLTPLFLTLTQPCGIWHPGCWVMARRLPRPVMDGLNACQGLPKGTALALMIGNKVDSLEISESSLIFLFDMYSAAPACPTVISWAFYDVDFVFSWLENTLRCAGRVLLCSRAPTKSQVHLLDSVSFYTLISHELSNLISSGRLLPEFKRFRADEWL